MVQDTSFLIDVFTGDPDPTDALELIERETRPEKIASVRSLELSEGVQRSEKSDSEKRAVLRVLDSKHVLPGDHAVMSHAGEPSGRLVADGDRIDREDCIIAATAIQENDAVLARTGAPVGRIPNLDVETD